jgi:hypothetical protein
MAKPPNHASEGRQFLPFRRIDSSALLCYHADNPPKKRRTGRTGERHDGTQHHDDGNDAHDEHVHDVLRAKPPEAFPSLIPYGS